MVQALHMQDNLSKTILVQQVVDQMITGSEQARIVYNSIIRDIIDENLKKKMVSFADSRTATAISRDGHQGREKQKHKRKKDTGSEKEESIESYSSNLRLRIEEDDRGKGDLIDLNV